MIFKAKNGAEIIEKINIDENEALGKFANLNHALVVVKIEDDYLLGWHKWRSDWETFGGLLEEGESLKECHEEYVGLYGITLSRDAIQIIEEKRQDKDEIGEIGLYSELKARKENIDEINEKLLEFY